MTAPGPPAALAAGVAASGIAGTARGATSSARVDLAWRRRPCSELYLASSRRVTEGSRRVSAASKCRWATVVPVGCRVALLSRMVARAASRTRPARSAPARTPQTRHRGGRVHMSGCKSDMHMSVGLGRTREAVAARTTRHCLEVNVGSQRRASNQSCQDRTPLGWGRQRNVQQLHDKHMAPPRTTSARCGGATARELRTNRTLSRRPGLSIAGSMMSGRFVAAMTKTSPRVSKPSSSVNSWFTTRSLTPPAPELEPLRRVSHTRITLAPARAPAHGHCTR